MSKQEELTIGEIFKNTRQNSNIEIEEISNILKINKNDIVFFEKHNHLPKESHIYISGFIKSYAHLLKIDTQLVENKIKELKIKSNIENQDHELVNIAKGNIYSPNKKILSYAILLSIAIYLYLFAFYKLKPNYLYNVDSVITELENL